MTTISLKTASDEAINAAVAEHCAGWTNVLLDSKKAKIYRGNQIGTVHRLQVADYLHDANAVIELLEKANFAVEINFDPTCDTWHVLLMGRFNSEYSVRSGPQETFCKAAAIALLKASRKIEVTE